MSKLIEADKLIHNLKKWSDIAPGIQRRNEDFIKILENEDTVKAVPIERLEKIREEMMRYSAGFIRPEQAYIVNNCIKMLDKALKEQNV